MLSKKLLADSAELVILSRSPNAAGLRKEQYV